MSRESTARSFRARSPGLCPGKSQGEALGFELRGRELFGASEFDLSIVLITADEDVEVDSIKAPSLHFVVTGEQTFDCAVEDELTKVFLDSDRVAFQQ